MKLTHGALFEGYGGTSMSAAAALNVELDTRWYSEIKPASIALLDKRLPGVENLGDIKEIGFDQVEKVDVLTGSWPCQPHSSAGKRLGLADPRALWPDVCRAIEQVRPLLFMGENVARITTNGELRRVVRTLAEIGYVGAWRCITAASVGAPHKRDRCFIVAIDADATRDGWAERWSRAARVVRGSNAALGGGRSPADSERAGVRDESGWGGGPDGTGPGIADDDGAEGSFRPEPHAARIVRALLPTPTERLGSGKRGLGSAENGRKRLESGRRNLDDPIAAHCLDGAVPAADAGDAGSLLPTPTARDGGRGAGYGDQPGRPLSETIHRLLPTPTQNMKTGAGDSGRDGGLNLQTAATRLLPTPIAGDAKSARNDTQNDGAGSKRGNPVYSGGFAENGHDDGSAAESGPDEVVRDVRGTDDAAAIQRAARGPDQVSESSELLAGVREYEAGSGEVRAALAGTQAAEADVRGLCDDDEPARAPQGQEPGKQRTGEPGDAVRDVSPDAALAGGSSGPSCGCAAWGQYGPAIHRWELILGRPAPAPTQLSTRKPYGPQLSPRAVEFMMGVPEGWVTNAGDLTPRGLAPAERNAQLSLLGDGVCPPQGEAAFRDLLEQVQYLGYDRRYMTGLTYVDA